MQKQSKGDPEQKTARGVSGKGRSGEWKGEAGNGEDRGRGIFGQKDEGDGSGILGGGGEVVRESVPQAGGR